MAALNGFVKLHRKMIEWGWYSDCVVKDTFLHILMVANWKDGEYLGHKLKAGDAIIGRKKLAQELGFTEQQIRTALKKLESTGEIKLKSTNRFTIVSVENWGFYQGDDEDTNQQITNKQPTDNQQITNKQPHLKKDKKDKKEKKDNNIKGNSDELQKKRFIPPTVDEVHDYCCERGNTVDPEAFVAFYESKNWMVGKNKMTSWKSAVITWEKNKKNSKTNAKEDAIKNRVSNVDNW